MFHTLLENALSHNRYEAQVVGFRLQQHREGNRSRFVFEAPRGDQDVPEGGLGIGLKYVRARLREAFGDDWELTFDGREGLWRTEINIPAERAGSKP